MNFGLAVSADSTRLPSARATLLSGGNCSLRLTSADCAPAVERPSSQAQPSMMWRKSATSALSSISGTQISISPAFAPRSESGRKHHADAATRRHEHERRRALIKRVVVQLVGEIGDEQLCGPVLVDLGFDERIEAPVIGKYRALVRGEEGSAAHLRAVHRLPADLPDIGELVFCQQAERLMGDVGERP